MFEGFHMGVSQIIYMNVVADAGSVGSGIVGSENMQFRGETGGGAQGQRDEMSFGIVQLTDFTALVCARSVEITQAGVTELVGAVVTLERVLKKQFRHSVGIYGLSRNILFDGNFRGLAIDCAGRGENDLLYARGDCGIEQGESAFNIVVKILLGVRHRFADIRVRCKVHDCVSPRERGCKSIRIQNVALDQLKTGRQGFIAGAKIVEDDDIVPGALKRPRRMTADVSRTTNDQDDHFASFPMFQVPGQAWGVEGSNTLYRVGGQRSGSGIRAVPSRQCTLRLFMIKPDLS